MTSNIAIIGHGNVGGALARSLQRVGYAVRTSTRDTVRDTARWGEVVILAVPFSALDAVLNDLGDALDGKVVVDTTNALTPQLQLALGFSTSGAEELQKKAPRARVVKAFNTVFVQHMDTGRVSGQPLTLFAAGDDAAARRTVLELGQALGFDAVDALMMRTPARWRCWATSTSSSAPCWATVPTVVSNSLIERGLA